MRALIYHAESESLFETTWEEFQAAPDSIDKGLCSDVTGIPEFEERYEREKETNAYDDVTETEMSELPNATLMAVTAKTVHRRSLNEAYKLIEQTETEKKEDTQMARQEHSARSSMRDAAKRRAEEQTHGGGGFSVNLPEGVKFFQNDGKRVEFDFVPYRISSDENPDVKAGRLAVGDFVDARFYYMHNDVGVEQKPYICLKTFGQRCPICEAQLQMSKNPKADPEVAKALKSKERVLYNVIDANDKEGKMMVMDVSYHNFTKQLEKEQRDREEYYDYADPDNGFTVSIRWSEESFNRNKFYKADRIDFEKRKPLGDADLKAAVDLDACLQKLSYEKLEAIFLGTEDQADKKEPAREERGREAKPVDEPRRGRQEPAVEPQARGRRGEAEPEKPAGGRRGTAGDDTVHRNDPDAKTGRHPVDPDQDEPGDKCPAPEGGKFGVDEGALEYCNKCDEAIWKACRDEKDRLAREKKAAKAEPEKPAGRRR